MVLYHVDESGTSGIPCNGFRFMLAGSQPGNARFSIYPALRRNPQIQIARKASRTR